MDQRDARIEGMTDETTDIITPARFANRLHPTMCVSLVLSGPGCVVLTTGWTARHLMRSTPRDPISLWRRGSV